MDWDDILMIGGFALAGWLGQKDGERRAYESMAQQNKEAEIARLQKEIEDLKKIVKTQRVFTIEECPEEDYRPYNPKERNLLS